MAARRVALLVLSLTGVGGLSAQPVPSRAATGPAHLASPNADVLLARACRASVSTPDALQRLLPALVRGLPASYPTTRLQRLRLVPLPAPSDDATGPAAIAGFEWQRGRPVLYWSPGIAGATVLHELTHAVQSDLRADVLRRLIARINHEDSLGTMVSADLARATQSVQLVVAGAVAPNEQPAVAARVARALGAVSPLRRGALARRRDAVIRALEEPTWADVREGLGPDDPRRFGHVMVAAGIPWTWRDEIRALFALELMAYDADRVCRTGEQTRFWRDATGTAP